MPGEIDMSDVMPGSERQPFLADEIVVLQAPVQAWSGDDAAMGAAPVHGLWVGDTRVLSELRLEVDGSGVETIACGPRGSDQLRAEFLLRGFDGPGLDPDVRLTLDRRVTRDGLREELLLSSRAAGDLDIHLAVHLRADASSMADVKTGRRGTPPDLPRAEDDVVRWRGGGIRSELTAPEAKITVTGPDIILAWQVVVPAGGSGTVVFAVSSQSTDPVVEGVSAPPPWADAAVPVVDDRLARWLARALDDLAALRLTLPGHPDDVFLAAGAPWFFTLFGRDSLWAARFLLPVDVTVAAGTLRTLARLQGREVVPATAEEPGKIPHELRRETLHLPGEGISLPPLYYGTIDATPLWVCLLHDAWRAGMPEDEVRALLPNLQRALAWMRDHGDSDGDGFLEYRDETGHGLANQGWKDSADGIRWRSGVPAEGPIALCEVQAYAHEAAVHGADLLDHVGLDGGDDWRAWAAGLRENFRRSFWVADEDGPYPAVALDAQKLAVDSLTSNIGHLLGSGLLDPDEEELVARRLVSPDLCSGFGLRTTSTRDRGYWPLSYHCGSVWTHDTAIAIAGLLRSGRPEPARVLAEGLLTAAAGFDYRMPELHSGDPATRNGFPVPYPAACRPQAWSAAAAVVVASARRDPGAPEPG